MTDDSDKSREVNLRHDGIFWRNLAYRASIRGPEWWKRLLPPLAGMAIFGLVGENRRGAVANLKRVLGDHGFLRNHLAALRMFMEFARVFRETCEVQHEEELGLNLESSLAIELPPDLDLDKIIPENTGVIALTSHFGCWEIGARVRQRFDRQVNLVMAHEGNPTVQAFQDKMRGQMGLNIIYSDNSPFASVEMLRALRRGEVVAIQLDRSAPGQVTRDLQFFGRAAPFQVGPFHLARAAGVPIWPVFAVSESRRKYKFLPSRTYRIPRGSSEEVLEETIEEVVGFFEAKVRQYPLQWFQFRDFWANQNQ
jgi:lauroyl/myristoyl acyltransferase